MPDMLEEFARETIDRLLKEVPVEKRLQGLLLEQRLQGAVVRAASAGAVIRPPSTGTFPWRAAAAGGKAKKRWGNRETRLNHRGKPGGRNRFLEETVPAARLPTLAPGFRRKDNGSPFPCTWIRSHSLFPTGVG